MHKKQQNKINENEDNEDKEGKQPRKIRWIWRTRLMHGLQGK